MDHKSASQTNSRHIRLIVMYGIALAFLAGCVGSAADRRVDWLRRHAARVRTLEPADEDFADLEALGDAIGDARIVFLGEASHGEGATSLAKGRLIKFLHQRKGFDVLAWEAGFYDCAKAGEALAAPNAGDGGLDRVVPSWSESEQCRPVLKYVRETQRSDRPIGLVGMSWYTYGDSALFDDVIAFFEAVDPAQPTPDQRAALERFKAFLGDLGSHRRPASATQPPELEQLEAMIDQLERDPDGQFGRIHTKRRIGFMRQSLENLKSFMEFWYKPLSMGGAGDNPLGLQEGRNILFLAREYFPDRKIIVWAHNGHIARGSKQIEELNTNFKFNETIATGQRVHDALGDKIYSVMFTSHHGESNGWWNEPRELSPPPRGSLEDLLHRAGFEQAFWDLRSLPPKHWLRERIVARPVSYALMRADWSFVYDGVFFIDEMSASTPLGTSR